LPRFLAGNPALNYHENSLAAVIYTSGQIAWPATSVPHQAIVFEVTMSRLPSIDSVFRPRTALAVCAMALAVAFIRGPLPTQQVRACFGFFTRQVGGVSIDPQGVLEAPTADDQRQLDEIRRKTPVKAPAALEKFTELRAISLKQIEAALDKAAKAHKPVPEEIACLGGLQRVRYVFVYPERKDIVIAGPAEGWKMDALGNLVGVTTNRPVIMLDDLMMALRSGASSRTEPITCSIDPTQEGIQRLQAFVSGLRTIGNPEETMSGIEEALGPQQITVTGVPASSHFARVMVAADFRMKRLAMDFEPAPVKGMPSFLQMMKATGRGMSNMMPRWWLAPKYDPMAKAANNLAWELRGPGVKCMTNEDYINDAGEKKTSNKKNPIAEKWAATMTEKFPELAERDSSFGQLRNAMDLAVIGALIEKEHLLDLASLQLPQLMQRHKLAEYPAPKQTSSKASAVKQSHDWLISASGGVEMLPWHVASEVETVQSLGDVQKKFAASSTNFWQQ
jgi:hypothetical protein